MTTVIAPHVLSNSLSQPLELEPNAPYNELGCLEDAVQAFTKVVVDSSTSSTVQLHCSIPLGAQSPIYVCLDLHDLNHLRSKSLMLIHDLVKSLRSSGILATYSLTPAHSPLCLVCACSPGFNASRINTRALAMLQNAKLDIGEHVLLANLERYPSLIVI
ncbi:hypothetical protein BT96DRAFT_985869 [Gymnopus androsaceus JB14]|uniref:Uncharacterized protein n=1 Tax=Gymnopus androsaceus JB14 TaxID=1447944 RepID=A0A6A4IBP8_9AGAR|nr:hypothetical protein BT96DRAFT_985869 [Gymnopus androsaceus JB14]